MTNDVQTAGEKVSKDEAARVARQLAEYGFYVMNDLLPEALRTRPTPPARRAGGTQGFGPG